MVRISVSDIAFWLQKSESAVRMDMTRRGIYCKPGYESAIFDYLVEQKVKKDGDTK